MYVQKSSSSHSWDWCLCRPQRKEEVETPQGYEKLYLSEVITLHAQLLITFAVTSPCCTSSVAWCMVMRTWFIQLYTCINNKATLGLPWDEMWFTGYERYKTCMGDGEPFMGMKLCVHCDCFATQSDQFAVALHYTQKMEQWHLPCVGLIASLVGIKDSF